MCWQFVINAHKIGLTWRPTRYANRKRTLASLLTLLLALLTFSFASAPLPAAAKGSYRFDFEEGVKPWSAAGQPASRNYSLDIAHGSNVIEGWYANLSAQPGTGKTAQREGIPLPVGTWMVAAFPAQGFNEVALSFSAISTKECVGCYLKVYAGPEAPRSITQFRGVDDGRPLDANWQGYYPEAFGYANPDGVLYVAIGWGGTDASIGLDCLQVTIYPFAPPPPPPAAERPTN